MHLNTINDAVELLIQSHPGSKNEILHVIAYQENVSLPHPDHVARNTVCSKMLKAIISGTVPIEI